MRTLRKLVFGETWTLPAGVFLAVGAAAVLSRVAGPWWHDGGGPVLLAAVVGVLLVSGRRAALPAPAGGSAGPPL